MGSRSTASQHWEQSCLGCSLTSMWCTVGGFKPPTAFSSIEPFPIVGFHCTLAIYTIFPLSLHLTFQPPLHLPYNAKLSVNLLRPVHWHRLVWREDSESNLVYIVSWLVCSCCRYRYLTSTAPLPSRSKSLLITAAATD